MKVWNIIFSVLLLINFTLAPINAEEIYFSYENTTIIFDANSILTEEQKERVISMILYQDNDNTTYSLLCLFGHKTTTEYLNVLKHKVFTTDPRCADQMYELQVCSRCDHVDATLIGQVFISCCPED